MSHLEEEIDELKKQVLEMMRLVKSQLEKGQTAVLDFDKGLAHEIRSNEKRVNALELKIDRDCENILALFNPVAVDLRFIMASFKINSDLERLGDNAVGIAKYITNVDEPLENEILDEIRFTEMYNNALMMIDDVIMAFEKEDTELARKIFAKDSILNEINSNAAKVVVELIKDHPDRIYNFLYLLSIIRKLERVGDLTKNVAEEIIFYVEAKVLKHNKKKEEKTT